MVVQKLATAVGLGGSELQNGTLIQTITMTGDKIALRTLFEKGFKATVLHEMIDFAFMRLK